MDKRRTAKVTTRIIVEKDNYPNIYHVRVYRGKRLSGGRWFKTKKEATDFANKAK